MKKISKIALLASSCAILLAGCCQAQEENTECCQKPSVVVGETRGSQDFNIGVAGYTYRKFSLDQTLEALEGMGVHFLSIKDWWLPLDATAEQMDTLKAKCKAHGVDPYILGPIYMNSEADVDRTFDYVGRFGHKLFIGVPTYELTDYIIAKVKETGIRLAIHTHGPDKMPFPNISKVVEVYKDPTLGIGCCMDLGHSIRLGDDLLGDIYNYKDWIYDMHIKDESEASNKGWTWEMGRGVMNYVPIVKALREVGYQGKVSLEFEKNGDNPTPGVAESIGYFRGIADATAIQ